jgi:hypothetical protein
MLEISAMVIEGFNAPIDQEIIDLYPELNEQKKPIKTK